MTKPRTTVYLRLHVRFEDSPYNSPGDRYSHVYVMPVVMGRGKYGQQEFTAYDVDSYEIDDVPAAVRALKGLRVQAQMDDHSAACYGYRVHFGAEHDQLDLREAERILPVLRRIDRKMTALSDRFGYPRDLETFLSHLADALGITGKPFVRRVTDGQDYEGTGHRSMDTDALRYWLADETSKWRERHSIPVPAGNA
jgi:hypothetical protein